MQGDSNLSSFVWAFTSSESTSLRFTTAMVSARIVDPACSCKLQFCRFHCIDGFASTSSSRAVRVGQLAVQGAGPEPLCTARLPTAIAEASALRDTFMLRPCKFLEASSPRISTALGLTFVVVVFFQDMSWSTIHTRGLRLGWRTIRTSVSLARNLQGAAAAQYFKGNFEKKGAACRMDVQ
jgi:hypothetical protein